MAKIFQLKQKLWNTNR